jgi:hypothetical protein
LLAPWVGFAIATSAIAEDPPRRVGSLNYLSGEVDYALHVEAAEPGALTWSPADFNQPVCQDMSLQTGRMARARIRIGPHAIQLSSDTVLDMLNLNEQLIEASVRQGRIHLQLSSLGDGGSVELEISRGSLFLLQAGAYDIEAGSADQPSRITVFEGKARFVGGNADVPIGAGEEIQVSGAYPAVVTTERVPAGSNPATKNTGEDTHITNPPPPAPGLSTNAADVQAVPPRPNPAATNAQPPPSDDFRSWVATSEPSPAAQPSPRYVSREMTGYEELEPYGRWETLDDYGPVWFPTSVPADWAPYRFGHWTSIAPWGWTWIDDQPWGFAPFHFGRWVNIGDRWGWVPGAPVAHPVYAPALVAFLETSEGGAPAEGPDPPVGWFPLAPGDTYTPWFAAGPEYVRSVDIVYAGPTRDDPAHWHGEHGREIWRGERGREFWHGDFANRRFATLVHRDAFAQGRPISREAIRMSPDRFEHAAVMRGAPRVMPVVMRTMVGPGGLHGEPHGIAPGMGGPGGLRGEPHGVAPGIGGLRGEPHGIGQVAPHEIRPGYSREFAGPHAPAAAAQMGRAAQPLPHQYGRPEVFHTPAPTYHPAMQQFGRPQLARPPQMVGRGMAPAMGRGLPQVAARPAPAHFGGAVAARKK